MNHRFYDDAYIRGILKSVRSIAIVGASAKDVRPSYFVTRYLLEKGYKVFPINPGTAGKDILGQKVHGVLKDVPEPIDMVEVFRNSDAAPSIVAEALRLTPRPKVIWMQLGVYNEQAAAMAEAEGLQVVMDRCPKIEYGRLSGEIGWTGVNSRVISARKPVLRKGFQHRDLPPES